MSDKPIHQDWYKSSRDKNVEYKVMLFETFDYCTCKGFQVRKRCKHVKMAQEIMEFNNY